LAARSPGRVRGVAGDGASGERPVAVAGSRRASPDVHRQRGLRPPAPGQGCGLRVGSSGGRRGSHRSGSCAPSSQRGLRFPAPSCTCPSLVRIRRPTRAVPVRSPGAAEDRDGRRDGPRWAGRPPAGRDAGARDPARVQGRSLVLGPQAAWVRVARCALAPSGRGMAGASTEDPDVTRLGAGLTAWVRPARARGPRVSDPAAGPGHPWSGLTPARSQGKILAPVHVSGGGTR